MTHVCSFGAGDVTSAVAARVSQGAARALKLGRMKMLESGGLLYIFPYDSREEPAGTWELTAAAAEFSKASTASSQPRKPLTGPLSRSPRSGTPPRAPSKVAGPATSPPNCCCSAANQIRSSREAGVGHWGPPWTGLPSTLP